MNTAFLLLLFISGATAFSSSALHTIKRFSSSGTTPNLRNLPIFLPLELQHRHGIPAREGTTSVKHQMVSAVSSEATGTGGFADPKQCLVLTFELDISKQPTLRNINEQDLNEAANVVCNTVGAFTEGDIKVELVSNVQNADFSAVNCMEASPSWGSVAPVVIQIVHSSDANQMFVRTMVFLGRSDGVGALHAAFNIIEYLERREQSKEPKEILSLPGFAGANTPQKVNEELTIGAHLKALEELGVAFDASKHDKNGKLPAGPARCGFEEELEARVYTRFTESKTTFKEFVSIAEEVQQRLELPDTIYTVNYSPRVALGKVSCVSETLVHEKRLKGIFTPAGPPVPMDLDHARFISKGIFWNNYGKHDPKFSAEVKGLTWNWTGLPKCAVPVLYAVSVQGKPFFVASFAARDQSVCEDLLAKIDAKRDTFVECKQPSVGGSQ